MDNSSTELFASYEAELKLVIADLTQKLDSIPELSGEARKSAIAQARKAVEEGQELVSLTRSRCTHIQPTGGNKD